MRGGKKGAEQSLPSPTYSSFQLPYGFHRSRGHRQQLKQLCCVPAGSLGGGGTWGAAPTSDEAASISELRSCSTAKPSCPTFQRALLLPVLSPSGCPKPHTLPKLLPNLQIWEGKEKGGRGSFQRGSQGNLSPELSDSLQWDASTVSLSARAHCRPALRRDSFQGHQQDPGPPHRVEGAARRHRAINPPCRVSGAEGRAVARQYPSAYTPASAAPSEKQRAVRGAFLLPPPLLQG